MGNVLHSFRNYYFNALNKSCKHRCWTQKVQRGSPWKSLSPTLEFRALTASIRKQPPLSVAHHPSWDGLHITPAYTRTYTFPFSFSLKQWGSDSPAWFCAQGWMYLDASSLMSVACVFPTLMDMVRFLQRKLPYTSLCGSLSAQGLGWLRRAGKPRGSLPPSLHSAFPFVCLLPKFLPRRGFMTSFLWECVSPAFPSHWSSIHRLSVSLSPHFSKSLLCR